MRCLTILAISLFGLSSAANAAVATVVSTTGGSDTLDPFIGSGNSDLNQGEIIGFSWIQTGTFTNVTVAVSVRALDSKVPNVTAYLTNAIGPGATTSNLIAQKTLPVFVFQSAGPYPLVTFFTGLTLPAGTYYLTMVGDLNQGPAETQNVSDGNGTPVLGSGVTLDGSHDWYAAEPGTGFGGPIDTTFPPASTFFFAGGDENGGRLIVNVLSGVQAPTIQKSFGVSAMPVGNSTSLQFTIANPNSISLTGIAFTDTLPAGLTLQDTLTSVGCGSPTDNSTTAGVDLSGITIPANSSCTLTFPVVGPSAGLKTNVTSAVTSNEAAASAVSNTATITIVAPPSISKAFGATAIALNGTTSLTFTITNPNTGTDLAGLAFTDTLPAGLVFVSSLNPTCGGTSSIVNATSLSVSGGTLAAGSMCSVSITVQGTTAGAKLNSVTVSSTNGGTGNTSMATVTVIGPPTISKSFGASSVPLNGTTSVTFTIANPNATSLSGVGFSDMLPAGLQFVIALSTATGCGSQLESISGTTLGITGASIAGNGSCTVVANVQGKTAGSWNNTTTAATSTEGGTGSTSNTATLIVAAPPSIGKSFGATTVPLNGTTTLTFSISNPNAAVALAGVAFTDTLPSGVVVAASANLTNSCNGTPAASGGSVSLTGGTIAGGGSCTLSVNVQGTTAGLKSNSVQVTSTTGGTGNTANASLTVVTPPSIGKAFGVSELAMNGTTSLTFTITNPNSATALTGVGFSDTFPAGLVLASPTNLNNMCGGTPATTATSVGLTGATLAGGASCTLSLSVQGTQAGMITNMVSVTSTNGGAGNTASANLTIGGPPKISKSFGAMLIKVGGITSLSFTVTNPNAQVSLTGIAFTDTLPSGLVVATPSGLSGMCGGMVTAGGAAIQLSNGALAGGANCTITVNVKAIADGMQNNTTSPVTSNEGGNGGAATASILVADPPQVTKAFGALALPVGSTATVTFTITNPNTNVTLTGINYIDTLPAGLKVATPDGLTNTCGGTASTTTNTIVLTGASLATGASCSVTANIAGTRDAVVTNTVTVNSDQGAGNTASAVIAVGGIFSVNYAANLNVGDSFIDITNTGSSNGANLCVNLFVFDPAEELISCCSCAVTPNGLQTLSVQQSLIIDPLTPAVPTAIVIKAIATTGACNASTASAGSLAPGALAWGTTLHQNTGSASFQLTERPFSQATLSAAELAHITSTCSFIQSNGSSFGICKGCAAGGLGAGTPVQ